MSTTQGGSLSQASTHRLQGISMTTSYVSPHLQTTKKIKTSLHVLILSC